MNPLKNALTEAIELPDKILLEMGQNGRNLIEDKYSMQKVAQQMNQLYSWILNNENTPEFINTK